MWWMVSAAVAQPVPQAFVGATVHPVSSDPIPDAALVVHQGRIVAIGPRGEVPVPDDAVVHDVSGKVLIPGLVDTHSHIGGGRLNEMSGPLQPAVSAVDAIDATHVSIQLAQAGGLTTVNVMPGSGNLIGGQTAYLKLRDVATVDEMLLCANRRDVDCGGVKMANGTNPQGQGPYPRTRMGAAAQLREQLLEARKHVPPADDGKKKRKNKGGDGQNGLSPAQQTLVDVLQRKRVVHFHTHRADDVATILELKQEFGFDVVLHHVSEAWKVADRIAEAGAPCSLIVIDSPGGKEEAVELKAENGGILEDLGVLVSLHTDDPITDSRLFLRSAGLAARAGMSEAGALAALTLSPAKQLHLEQRVGSLEVGKDADLVVLSGPPLSVWTRVEQTWIEGSKVFDRATDLAYAQGGYAVPAR